MITLLAVAAIVFLIVKGRAPNHDASTTATARELDSQAVKHGLNADSVMVRKHWAILLDRQRGQLLYLDTCRGRTQVKLLDVDNVVGCDVVKTRTGKPLPRPAAHQPKRYIDQILLNITSAGGSCQIPFFHFGTDKLSDMKMLYRQARQWQRLIRQ